VEIRPYSPIQFIRVQDVGFTSLILYDVITKTINIYPILSTGICRASRPDSGDYDEYYILVCDAVSSTRSSALLSVSILVDKFSGDKSHVIILTIL
jgi:hypothetical protein